MRLFTCNRRASRAIAKPDWVQSYACTMTSFFSLYITFLASFPGLHRSYRRLQYEYTLFVLQATIAVAEAWERGYNIPLWGYSLKSPGAHIYREEMMEFSPQFRIVSFIYFSGNVVHSIDHFFIKIFHSAMQEIIYIYILYRGV